MGQVAILASSLLIAASIIASTENFEGDNLEINEYVTRYRSGDDARNNGAGNSTYTSSSTLAWGESYILCNYIRLYRVTGDAYWLEKVIQHFDQMIYGMTQSVPQTNFREFSAGEIDALVAKMIYDAENCDFGQRDEDAHPVWNTECPGWYTDRYSVAHVNVVHTNSGTARLAPESEKISNIERAHQITGRMYQIQFHNSARYTVEGFDAAELVEPDNRITEIPGASLRVEGSPKPGDTFTVKTINPKPLQYTVHDGMALYPVAQLVEIVLNDADLRERFGGKIESYIRLIREVFVRKWERYWVELDNDAGAYKFTESPAERAPNKLLPHNQYNAMCRAYLVLQDRNVLDDPELRQKARKMIRYFKSNLRPTGDAWTWNYWDWGDGEDEHSGVEDSSHASINVGAAIEAYHRGIEFDQEDMARFAHTLLDQMWNRSLENPNVGDRVDTDKGEQYFPVKSWIELCEFDRKVWDVCYALFKLKGEPANLIPVMLHAQTVKR